MDGFVELYHRKPAPYVCVSMGVKQTFDTHISRETHEDTQTLVIREYIDAVHGTSLEIS